MEIQGLINEINDYTYSFKERYFNNLTHTQRTVATIALIIFSTFLVCHVITQLKEFIFSKPNPTPNLAEIDSKTYFPLSEATPIGPPGPDSTDDVNPEIETTQVDNANLDKDSKKTEEKIPYMTKEEYFKWAEDTCKIIYQQPNLTEEEKAAQFKAYIEILDFLRPDPNRPLNVSTRSISNKEYCDKMQFSHEKIFKQTYLSDKEKSELLNMHARILNAQKIVSPFDIALQKIPSDFFKIHIDNRLQERERFDRLTNEEWDKEIQKKLKCSDKLRDELLADRIKQKQLQTELINADDDIYG